MKDIELLKSNGVDLEHGLELLGDQEMYDETLGDFITDIESNFNNLKNYKESGDLANYAIIAHSFKSDSKYLGFMKLAELGLAHEMAGKNGDKAYIDTNFNEFVQEIGRMYTLAKKYLGRE